MQSLLVRYVRDSLVKLVSVVGTYDSEIRLLRIVAVDVIGTVSLVELLSVVGPLSFAFQCNVCNRSNFVIIHDRNIFSKFI